MLTNYPVVILFLVTGISCLGTHWFIGFLVSLTGLRIPAIPKLRMDSSRLMGYRGLDFAESQGFTVYGKDWDEKISHAMEIVSLDARWFPWFESDLQKEERVIKASIVQNVAVFPFVGERWRNNSPSWDDFAATSGDKIMSDVERLDSERNLELLKEDCFHSYFVHIDLFKNRTFASEALQICNDQLFPIVLLKVPVSYREDEQFMIGAVSGPLSAGYTALIASEKLRNSTLFMEKICLHNGWFFSLGGEEPRKDLSVISKAIVSCKRSFYHLSKELQGNIEIISMFKSSKGIQSDVPPIQLFPQPNRKRTHGKKKWENILFPKDNLTREDL